MSVFYVPPEDVLSEKLILKSEEFHHAVRVLRHRTDDIITVIDGRGNQYKVRIEGIGADFLEGNILEKQMDQNEPLCYVALAQALIKGDRFDWLVEKCTEIGVSAILPVITSRTIPSDSETRYRRWQRIALSAVKQSQRSRLPEINRPLPLSDTLNLISSYDLLALASEKEKEHSLRDILKLKERNKVQKVGLLIGPEGGFDEDEFEMIRSAGAMDFTLGPRRLRSETAGIVACSLLLHEVGELGSK